MNDIGIVFAGGGGKGAYEIGVWKYLHEIGLEKYVSAVSGTSVGALNAALFTCGNYEIAEEIWKSITPKQILKMPKMSKVADVILLRFYMFNLFENLMMKDVIGNYNIVGNRKIILSKIISMISHDYIFSKEGLKELINTGLDLKKIRNSEIECSITCFNYTQRKLQYFDLNNFYKEDITTLLLASSAIPFIYKPEKFYGNIYYDGGLPMIGDNVPIKPLYDRKIKNIIVIQLDKDNHIDKSKYLNSNIIEISPSEDLGNFINGALNFDSTSIDKRMKLGYNNAKKVLKTITDDLPY